MIYPRLFAVSSTEWLLFALFDFLPPFCFSVSSPEWWRMHAVWFSPPFCFSVSSPRWWRMHAVWFSPPFCFSVSSPRWWRMHAVWFSPAFLLQCVVCWMMGCSRCSAHTLWRRMTSSVVTWVSCTCLMWRLVWRYRVTLTGTVSTWGRTTLTPYSTWYDIMDGQRCITSTTMTTVSHQSWQSEICLYKP